MLPEQFSKKWLSGFLCIFLAISAIAVAQEQRTRTPGRILPPQQSGILLMESRLKMEKPDTVLQFMGLRDGDIVADIGCGNGFYTLRLANEISPRGIVFAVDVQQGMLDQLAERQKEANISNVYPILGEYEDPLLPPGKIDWILLVDTYHEFTNPEAMLARMKDALAPGGRVALIEYRGERGPGKNQFPIPNDHSMTVDQVMREWPPAGFELVTRVDFLPMQHFFVFKNADDGSRPAIRALTIGDTRNVATFDNRVYFAGQTGEDAFKQFAEFGVKTVINLRNDQEPAGPGFDEKEVVEKIGMKYVHAPMDSAIPDTPTLQEIVRAMDSAGDAPVLLHCSDSNRAGAIWSFYAGKQGNLTVEEAIAEGKEAGMSLPATEKAVREALSRR